jgi:hypothetical protein
VNVDQSVSGQLDLPVRHLHLRRLPQIDTGISRNKWTPMPHDQRAGGRTACVRPERPGAGCLAGSPSRFG